MLIKLGVDISCLNRQIRRALPIVEKAFQDYANTEAIITSTYEGNHGVGSLHYADDAIDFRLPPMEEMLTAIIGKLKIELGAGYDVLKSNNCLHIEWDPK